jgi:BlaI family penicillinase repressor
LAVHRLSISDAELDVLKTLWAHGPGTVREIEGRLRRKKWAYNTILTLLSRLREKGYVSLVRDAGERVAHVFQPAVTQAELLGDGLRELSKRLADGTASPLVQALVKEKLSKEEIAELRKMLDKLEKDGGS